ncbi:hypothetical protein [Methanobacterium paludis]|nr:hypothetical protein [Methanobacterium paludis]
MVVPRWGVHEGVKYTPRRCVLKVCPICHELFVQLNKGKRLYCSNVCSKNARRLQMRAFNKRIQEKRDKFDEAERKRVEYAQKLRTQRTWTPGTMSIPKVKLDNEGNPDYDDYHQRLSRKLSMIRIR